MSAACPIHFVGSVPLQSLEEVLTTISRVHGSRVSRLPDGELSAKQGYVSNQRATFERLRHFQFAGHRSDWRKAQHQIEQFALKAIDDVPTVEEIGELGHARWAVEAYHVFAALKSRGLVHADARLKIALPSAYGVLSYFVEARSVPALMPVFAEALGREIIRLGQQIPHDELAVQIDASMEFEALASGDSRFSPITADKAAGWLARQGERLDTDIQLGLHCCYGNLNLKHYVEPKDTADMVAVTNALITVLGRPLHFVHMPVPIGRSDDAYFEPLKDLRLGEDAELFLGLVHDADGVGGAELRAMAARRAYPRFGVATECGLNHRPRENVLNIIELLREVSDCRAAELPRFYK